MTSYKLVNQILEGMICLFGEDGNDFIYYETLLRWMENFGLENTYRGLN